MSQKNNIMIIDNVNIAPLLKAFSRFEQFRPNKNTEQERAGIIQAFEYSFELVWKIMKKLLHERGREVNSPREVFRVAFLEGFIDDLDIWFDFLKKRNMVSHTYEEEEANQVLLSCDQFSVEVKKFLNKIGVQS
jgi:nucleotidyltransferase substrate binding protein (TIGR01987 family)